MTRFTKEQLVGWGNSLIEETHTDISISRTDAHAESYRAQLALLEIALAALTDQPVGYYRKATTGDGYYLSSTIEPQPGTIPLYRLPLLEGLK